MLDSQSFRCESIHEKIVIEYSHAPGAKTSSLRNFVEVAQAAYREDSFFRGSHKDFSDCIESEQQEGFESSESVAEIHQGSYEDKEIENESSKVAKGHD